MQKGIPIFFILIVLFWSPSLGNSFEVKINGQETTYRTLASKLILSELKEGEFYIYRPTNLGLIEISTDFWMFEIRSDVAEMRQGGIITEHPYTLIIFLAAIHLPKVTEINAHEISSLRTGKIKPSGTGRLVNIHSVSLIASKQFNTKEELEQFLTQRLLPFLDKPIVVSGGITSQEQIIARVPPMTIQHIDADMPITLNSIKDGS